MGEDAIVFHDGGSFGSSSLRGQPQQRVGVVVLSNETTVGPALHAICCDRTCRWQKTKRARRTEITLDTAVLDRYVGRYDMQDEGVVVIGRQGTLLTIELPYSLGLPKLRLHAEKEREFFATELPLQAIFEVDSSGRVTGMVVHPPRGQGAIPGRRL